MKEAEPDIEPGWADHLDVADEPVAGHVDEVAELHRDAEAWVREGHVGDERILRIAQLAVPVAVVEPRELAVDVETRAAWVAHGLVGVADPRKVEVANRVGGVVANQHVAVADHEVAGHGLRRIVVTFTRVRWALTGSVPKPSTASYNRPEPVTTTTEPTP